MIPSTEAYLKLDIIRLMFGSQLARNKARNNLRRQGFTNHMLAQLNRKGELKTGVVGDEFELLTIPKGESPKPIKRPLRCPECPPYYLRDWKTSIEAAFGPITSFVSNLMLPDQSSVRLSVEVEHAGKSVEIGGKMTSHTQFDSYGLPTGFLHTSQRTQETGHSLGPVDFSSDGQSMTAGIDGGAFSGELDFGDSGVKKASINYGSKYFQPGLSINNQGEVAVNTKVEAEASLGSILIKIKGKIESLFDPDRPLENAAKTSTDIENRLRR